MSGPMRVGITADLRGADGVPVFGSGALAVLRERGIDWEWLEPRAMIEPVDVARFDGLYVNVPTVPASAFAQGAGRLRVVARHGVGYDSVDVAACTAAGVLVTIQPDGVRRPLAVAALTFVLALSQRLMAKDRLLRAGRWDERVGQMGLGLTSRTLGVLGAGNIGAELLRLARPFGPALLACDPYVDATVIEALGATPVGFERLFAESDFVVVLVPLSGETRGLVGRAALARMKRTAFLVNVARGPVVDEAALIDALRDGTIAGAALDVFEREPVDPANPLLAMENVILTPHALCWTDECFAGIAESGMRSIAAALAGEVPGNALNPEAARARAP